MAYPSATFICGTGTNVGKTMAAAAIMRRYGLSQNLRYWKVIQTGSAQGDSDRRVVQRLSGLADDFFLPEACIFQEPLSPHRAAELEDSAIELDALVEKFRVHARGNSLLMEGAGGLFVPLNRACTWLDFLKSVPCSVLLAASSELGTINHSLLTWRCLMESGIEPALFIFCGPLNRDNMQTVAGFTNLPVLPLVTGAHLDLDAFDPDRLLENILQDMPL